MNAPSHWMGWAARLKSRGLALPVAAVLEAAGPLTLLAAQAATFSQPFLQSLLPDGEWESIARTLEDRGESRQLIEFLREEEKP